MPTYRFAYPTIACLLLAAASASAHDNDNKDFVTRYKIKEIVPPQDPRCLQGYQRVTYARRMNRSAEAVGYDSCYQETGDPSAPRLPGNRAFRWSRANGSLQLPALSADAVETWARDINSSGTVVGWQAGAVDLRAPVWPADAGVTEIAPTICPEFGGVAITSAESINQLGSIAFIDGFVDAAGNCNIHWKLKLVSGEVVVSPIIGASLTAVNDNNVMVGLSGTNAVKWSAAAGEVILFAGSSPPSALVRGQAWNINKHDAVVGVIEHYDSSTCQTASEAMLWDADGTAHVLPLLHGDRLGVALAIDKHGTIVGYSQHAATADCNGYDAFGRHAVIWHKNRVRDLNKLIPDRYRDEIQLIQASSINEHGQILARGIRPNEPLQSCPNFSFNPVTEELFYDTSLLCVNEYSFLLTPKD
ncbi:MAG TPA: hypothetical protein VGN07_02860 [Steroidobacteraceae bacterium]